MIDFIFGQCWFSEFEIELGFGLIKEVDYCLVMVFYLVVEEEWIYVKNNVFLLCIIFDEGDILIIGDGLELVV